MSEEVEVQTVAADIPAPELETTAAPVEESKPVKTFTQEELDSIVAKRLAKEQRKLTRQAELEVENRLLREQVTKREVKSEPSAPNHLAKHSAELERIVKLKPHAALMALGKLEDKLSQAPELKKVPVSKAPEPIKPVGGKSEVSTGHHPNDSFETFMRKRNIEKGRI